MTSSNPSAEITTLADNVVIKMNAITAVITHTVINKKISLPCFWINYMFGSFSAAFNYRYQATTSSAVIILSVTTFIFNTALLEVCAPHWALWVCSCKSFFSF